VREGVESEKRKGEEVESKIFNKAKLGECKERL
jgi:hypothetical protein